MTRSSIKSTEAPEFRIQWAKGKESSDVRTLNEWMRERITTSEANRQIERRYKMHQGSISPRVFTENAHWLGYWRGYEWKERVAKTEK